MDKLKSALVKIFTCFHHHHHNNQLSSSETVMMKMRLADWSSLPDDLLAWIAERLDLIDLLRFRAVCKDWYFSSSSASATIESENKYPCLLLYGEGSKCTFFHQKLKKKYTIEIPELEGATCIASSHGWILLFKDGLLFFFCPFSRAKIHLPHIPGLTTITNHVAGFSAPPTSKECTVSLMNKRSDENGIVFEVNVLTHGDDMWTKYERSAEGFRGEITDVFSHGNDVLYYVGSEDSVGKFSLTDSKWQNYVRVPRSSEPQQEYLPFRQTAGESYRNYNVNKWIKEDEISDAVPTCGTILMETDMILHSRSSNTSLNRKGVWIQPRYFQVPQHQNWSQI